MADEMSQSEMILYQTEDGRTRIQCRFENESIWLTQALIAELFQVTPQNVTLHLKAIYEEGELDEAATCKDYLQVRSEGGREVSRKLRHYDLAAILAVGYRIRSHRGTQFRQWATARLSEYLVKGFVMDDERLKNPPGKGQKDYFDELLERMVEGTEGDVPRYPTPDELWNLTFAEPNAWRDRFAAVPFEDRGGYFQGRYYQDIAIERVLEAKRTIKIKLADGKERTIQHMMATTFWHPDGTPMSAQQFMESLYGRFPDFFHDEADLRSLWSAPDTRAKLLEGLAEKGFGLDQMTEMQKIIDAEKSDLFDVLAYVAFTLAPRTREERATRAKVEISNHFDSKPQAFLDFVLAQYVKEGVGELNQEKLSPLLKLKYNNALADAFADLGQPEQIKDTFSDFQKYLYQGAV